MNENEPRQEDIDFQAPETGESSTEQQELVDTYVDSELLNKKDIQEERGEEFGAIFTDVDNTFYRADRSETSKELKELAEDNSYPIVAVTGNSFEIMEERITNGELPKFDVIIGSVGTEIFSLQNDGETYKKDIFYDESLLHQSVYDRSAVSKKFAELISLANSENSNFELNYQLPEIEEGYLEDGSTDSVQPYKISGHFFASSNEELNHFTEIVGEQFPDQEIVICEEIGYNSTVEEGDTRLKYCLDVVPITKRGSVEYLANMAGVERGVVAGDSGNDMDMLLETGEMTAIVVGGAKKELVSSAKDVGVNEKRSFTEVTDKDGNSKAIYLEKKERLGPESIIHAAKVLLRAERMKKLGRDTE